MNRKTIEWTVYDVSHTQAAIEKWKEADRLVAMNKITPQDKLTMAKGLSTMSYSLQGESLCTALHTTQHSAKYPRSQLKGKGGWCMNSQ